MITKISEKAIVKNLYCELCPMSVVDIAIVSSLTKLERGRKYRYSLESNEVRERRVVRC
jgi:hypothetical protein